MKLSLKQALLCTAPPMPRPLPSPRTRFTQAAPTAPGTKRSGRTTRGACAVGALEPMQTQQTVPTVNPPPNPTGKKRAFAAAFPDTNAPPAKMARCERQMRLLDLSDDVLSNILTRILAPAKEGSRQIVTEEGIKASLPAALACRHIHSVWKRSLQDLELWVTGQLDDRGLLSIARANGPHIHRLGVRKCKRLSLPTLEMLPGMCPNLRSLDLSGLAISDTVVEGIAEKAGGSLHFLAMNGCTGLTERAFKAIAAKCKALRFLDVGDVAAVDDAVLGTLVQSLGGTLRTLVISGCSSITDAGVASAGAHCRALLSLTMRSLPLVTDLGLISLCAGIGPRVQILDVLDCTGITLGGYAGAVERHCPHVRRFLEESGHADRFGERCLRDTVIATMPGLIYRISATDAFRRRPALYFLLLDESTLRPFRVSVQSKSLNLSDFGAVLISNFGKRPTVHTKHVLLERFGYDSPADDIEEGCKVE